MQSEKKGANCNNNKSYYSKSKTSKDCIMCMTYMWHEWTQDDKLSKICKDVKGVPMQKCINLGWKSDN